VNRHIKQKPMSTGNGAHYLKKVVLVLFLFLFIFLVLVYMMDDQVVLQVRKYETGKIVYQKKLQLGETFTLTYIHSVTEQPVYEVFFVKDKNTLALKEMRYDSFGANLPVGPEKLRNEETKFIVEEDYYKILYQDRSFNIVPLRVGQVIADHTLVFEDGESLHLLDVADGGDYVEFYVLPIWKLFFNRLIGGSFLICSKVCDRKG